MNAVLMFAGVVGAKYTLKNEEQQRCSVHLPQLQTLLRLLSHTGSQCLLSPTVCAQPQQHQHEATHTRKHTHTHLNTATSQLPVSRGVCAMLQAITPGATATKSRECTVCTYDQSMSGKTGQKEQKTTHTERQGNG